MPKIAPIRELKSKYDAIQEKIIPKNIAAPNILLLVTIRRKI